MCVMLAAVALWYVRPEQELDLAFAQLKLEDQAAEMLRTRKLEVVLSEAEINDLLKEQLAQKQLSSAGPPPKGRITGASFSLQGNLLIADVNVLVREQWKVGAKLQFRLEWQDPYLVATHTDTHIKAMNIPLSWYEVKPLKLAVNNKLPKLIAVRNVEFQEKQINISFRLR
ncbi:hypothetical protein RAC89_17660 [Paenibacillus sp. GD4]|uniref:hypothetical protein n=1 Tax=Paenibacillus sp. GD4 TaxID=3068890 RepID=UPI00279667B3|nr:hypothetical protein [Paenibacillus sp. GD4]MDQ1912217.1 hypothetical protein [Paenibacillus sp. GD4]